MGEEILTVMETRDRKALYFTTDSVIVAKLGGQGLMIPFGVVGAVIESQKRNKKKEELSKLSPESILTADKKNFEIPYTEINRVELWKKFVAQGIKLTTIRGKTHQFMLGKPEEHDSYVTALRPVLKDKLVIS